MKSVQEESEGLERRCVCELYILGLCERKISDLPYLKQQIFRQRSREMRQVVSREPMPNTKPWMPYQRHPVSPNTQAWHRLTEGEKAFSPSCLMDLLPSVSAKWLLVLHVVSITLTESALWLHASALRRFKLFFTWKWWKMAHPRGWSQNRREPGWWSWAQEVWASFFSYGRLTAPYHSPALMWDLEKEVDGEKQQQTRESSISWEGKEKHGMLWKCNSIHPV